MSRITAGVPCGTAVDGVIGMAKSRKRSETATPTSPSASSSSASSAVAPAPAQPPSASPAQPAFREAENNRQRIEQRAYELYLSRGGGHGSDWEDWLTAERELVSNSGGDDRSER
jgi:hypothetical protein